MGRMGGGWKLPVAIGDLKMSEISVPLHLPPSPTKPVLVALSCTTRQVVENKKKKGSYKIQTSLAQVLL